MKLYTLRSAYKPQPLQPSSHNLALPNLPTYRGVSNQTLCLQNLFGKSNAQNFAKIESKLCKIITEKKLLLSPSFAKTKVRCSKLHNY